MTDFTELLAKAAGFDPKKHPRWPKGHPHGGRFMPKGGGYPIPYHPGRPPELNRGDHRDPFNVPPYFPSGTYTPHEEFVFEPVGPADLVPTGINPKIMVKGFYDPKTQTGKIWTTTAWGNPHHEDVAKALLQDLPPRAGYPNWHNASQFTAMGYGHFFELDADHTPIHEEEMPDSSWLAALGMRHASRLRKLQKDAEASWDQDFDRRDVFEKPLSADDRKLQSMMREVFKPQPDLEPDEQWTPVGTCDSTQAALDEDGRIYDVFPGAQPTGWGGFRDGKSRASARGEGPDDPGSAAHMWFELPDGTIIDPTYYQFSGRKEDWYGRVWPPGSPQAKWYTRGPDGALANRSDLTYEEAQRLAERTWRPKNPRGLPKTPPLIPEDPVFSWMTEADNMYPGGQMRQRADAKRNRLPKTREQIAAELDRAMNKKRRPFMTRDLGEGIKIEVSGERRPVSVGTTAGAPSASYEWVDPVFLVRTRGYSKLPGTREEAIDMAMKAIDEAYRRRLEFEFGEKREIDTARDGQDLAAIMRGRHLDIEFDFPDGDVRSLKPAMKELERMLERYPAIKKELKAVKIAHIPDGGTWARWKLGTVQLNDDYFGMEDWTKGLAISPYEELESTLKWSVKTGHHPIGGDTIESIMTHELGHALEDRLEIEDRTYDPLVLQAEMGEGQYGTKNTREGFAEALVEIEWQQRRDWSPRAIALYDYLEHMRMNATRRRARAR